MTNHPLTTPLPTTPPLPATTTGTPLHASRAPKDGRGRDETGRFIVRCDAQAIRDICDEVRRGSSIDGAAAVAGVSRKSVYNWLREGRKDGADPILALFVEAFEQARGEEKAALERRLHELALEGDAKALTFKLERKFPDDYGNRQRIDHGNADDRPFQTINAHVDLSKLSDDELAAYRDLTAKAQPEPGADVIDLPTRRSA